MAEQHQLGKNGEEWARDFLEKKGHQIVEQNYSYQKAEIDIISIIDKQIVFTEVKTRYGVPLESIQQALSKRKQQQVIKAAHQYIIENNIDEEARFDIIWIQVSPDEKKTEHIEEAFYPM